MNIELVNDPVILAQLNKEIQELHVEMYPQKYKPYNFEAFKQTAFEKDIQRIELDVKYLNKKALRFFESMGFSPFNTMMEKIQ